MKCPSCGDENLDPDPAKNRWFPFCSERCKMVDLGHWFNGDYRISRPVEADDVPDVME